jgi:PAS domain-containing protein
VRRFTTPTAKPFNLIPTDTGRPITNITIELVYPQLTEDAREVLRTLIFRERDIVSRDGRWFTVRILPYRTLENVIDGVVLTFTDTTAANQLKMTLSEHVAEVKQVADSLQNLVLSCDVDGVCRDVSRQWAKYAATHKLPGMPRNPADTSESPEPMKISVANDSSAGKWIAASPSLR